MNRLYARWFPLELFWEKVLERQLYIKNVWPSTIFLLLIVMLLGPQFGEKSNEYSDSQGNKTLVRLLNHYVTDWSIWPWGWSCMYNHSCAFSLRLDGHGEWWKGWIWWWHIIRSFVNVTRWLQYDNNKNEWMSNKEELLSLVYTSHFLIKLQHAV
jgi:hypothetical protein